MTRVVEVPAHFDDKSFDQFAAWFGDWPPEERVLVDARGCQWGSPYGLVGLLTADQAVPFQCKMVPRSPTAQPSVDDTMATEWR